MTKQHQPSNHSTQQHQHDSSHTHVESNSRPHPLTQFFGCCLGDEPTPIGPKIQQIREKLPESQTTTININNSPFFQIEKDMVIADLIANFPQIKDYLQEKHPLGLMSPILDQLSLELFFSDFPEDIETICQELNLLIKNFN